jgi:hypothetical protein
MCNQSRKKARFLLDKVISNAENKIVIETFTIGDTNYATELNVEKYRNLTQTLLNHSIKLNVLEDVYTADYLDKLEKKQCLNSNQIHFKVLEAEAC